jgi:tRNA (guanosine-2'-O-)-methyltransferase
MLPDHIHPGQMAELTAYLSQFITAERFNRFISVLSQRTQYLTVVLEDIYQPHNASAVLRTCDCFGIQDVHIIENRNKYEVNPDVALGASKWLSLKKYNGTTDNTLQCLAHLKANGYRLVATSPHQDDYSPETLPIDQPIALMFGTELEGLTPAALAMADHYLMIPMVGFTESLNISVSAAILLQHLAGRIRKSKHNWQLTDDVYEEILLSWLMSSISKSDSIARNFLSGNIH